MPTLIAFVLIAQTLNPDLAVRGYVDVQGDQLVLAMPSGRYTVELAADSCRDVVPGTDVDVVAGSGGVATLSPAGHGELCGALITGIASDEPCATDPATNLCAVAQDTPGGN